MHRDGGECLAQPGRVTNAKGGNDIAKSDWIDSDSLDLALRLLLPVDQLIMRVILRTGLRIGDVLALRTKQIGPRITVREQKTGKSRRVYLGNQLADDILAQAGEVWAFVGAPRGQDEERPRSRQAVWRDLRRAAKACRIDATLSPHSGRKVWAVEQYAKSGGDVEAVQRKMAHDNPTTTLLYVLADHLSRQGANKKRKRGAKK